MSHSSAHGLNYPNNFIQSLNVLPAQSNSSIKLISSAQFSELHLRHVLAHPPDNVLFPFLHGLEGKNEDQYTFFVSGNNSVVRPPLFRGLVWVACEDDLDDTTRRHLARQQQEVSIDSAASPDEEDYEDEDEDLDDEDDEDESSFSQVSPPLTNSDDDQNTSFPMDLDDPIEALRDSQESHMHPVAQRHAINAFSNPEAPSKQPPDAIQTANFHLHDRRDSSASGFSESTSASGSLFSSPTDSVLSTPPFSAVTPPMEQTPESQQDRIDNPPLLTCTFRECDLLRHVEQEPGSWEFAPVHVPPGISLRNFGIQVPIYATLSDIVVYSPKGVTPAAIVLAKRFASAIQRKFDERLERCGPLQGEDCATEDDDQKEGLMKYNVFILDSNEAEMKTQIPHLMVHMLPSTAAHTHLSDGESGTNYVLEGTPELDHRPFNPMQNTVDFAQREKEEMKELTRATEILCVVPPDTFESSSSAQAAVQRRDPFIGQVFLGNSEDVPLCPDTPIGLPSSMYGQSRHIQSRPGDPDCPFNPQSNPGGYDICVECHDLAPFPSVSQLRLAEEHLNELERGWADRWMGITAQDESLGPMPPRPPPNANAIVHLPFPSSPPSTTSTMATLLPMLRFFEKFLQPIATISSPSPTNGHTGNQEAQNGPQRSNGASKTGSSRRWSSVSSLLPSFPSFPSSAVPPLSPPPSVSSYPNSPSSGSRSRSHTSPAPPSSLPFGAPARSRPLKILLYSADGYTESSVPALCLLMAVKGLRLPEAYLELQVVKKRSFFVYNWDLGVLRRVEGRVSSRSAGGMSTAHGHNNEGENGGPDRTRTPIPRSGTPYGGRPSAKSVSFARPSPPSTPSSSLPSSSSFPPSSKDGTVVSLPTTPTKGRQRANTLPNLAFDHLSWFNDTRFDGSFPSRVLPFLYLGNLNHATNAYMLHALGITHVVSVGECALVPPPASTHGPAFTDYHLPGAGIGANEHSHGQFVHRKEGSLWIEEREGRIKVLDIKGVCDDGIDTLEPQLEPICDWIDKAREEGGQVLVHCRVGVSRSATVTIAYVMKHLNLPLVDSYLIVRSRRLSVLIQPNMRLLYNLCGWEIKLAREKSKDGDVEGLKKHLARTLSWPYLSKEVHALNEKYLH